MQGIIVTPTGDVWALGISYSSSAEGDLSKGRIVCEGECGACKSFKAPFHLGIDQQDRIWVTDILCTNSLNSAAKDSTPG